MRLNFSKITPLAVLILAASLAGQTRQPCAVARVLDSCRVELASGEIVRLIGLQTFPNFSSSLVQSNSFLDSLVAGKSLWLEHDENLPAGFGYLWRDSLLINAELLRRGLLRVWDDTAQFKHQESLLVAEHKARTAKRGNWKSAAFLFAAVNETATAVDETVYVTQSGKKYHRAGCRLLAKNKTALPLSQARLNYGPCSLCAVSESEAQSIQPNSKMAATQCAATTKSGKRCTRNAEPGTKHCWQHRRK
jgi:endonuclease YncB( thermonuclease family)